MRCRSKALDIKQLVFRPTRGNRGAEFPPVLHWDGALALSLHTRCAAQVLDVKLPFDEAQLLRDNTEYLLRSLKLTALDVQQAESGLPPDSVAAPGAAGTGQGRSARQPSRALSAC